MVKGLLSPIYEKHINSVFRTRLNDRQLTFQLISVVNKTPPEGYECFSLFFLAPNDTPVAQLSYRLEHDEMEPGNVFLVPISQDEKGIVFEAVFNRLINKNQ